MLESSSSFADKTGSKEREGEGAGMKGESNQDKQYSTKGGRESIL